MLKNLKSGCIRLSSCLAIAGFLFYLPLLTAQNSIRSQPKVEAEPDTIEARGYVHPQRRVVIKLHAGEHLAEILVPKGARVKSGQALARIDNPTLLTTYMDLINRRNDNQMLSDDVEASTLELSLEQSDMDRLNAKIDTMRKESASLSDDSIDNLMVPLNEQHRDLEGKIKTTTMQLAHLQTRLQSRKESADFLEHELMSTKVRLAQNVIRAPFSGIIADRVEEPGWLSPEDMICEVWDDSAYRVEVELLQHQLSFVHPGQTVLVALDFGHNQSVRGTVESVDAGNLTPPVSGPPTFKAIVKLDGKVSWLQPGMQVSVRVHTGGAK